MSFTNPNDANGHGSGARVNTIESFLHKLIHSAMPFARGLALRMPGHILGEHVKIFRSVCSRPPAVRELAERLRVSDHLMNSNGLCESGGVIWSNLCALQRDHFARDLTPIYDIRIPAMHCRTNWFAIAGCRHRMGV